MTDTDPPRSTVLGLPVDAVSLAGAVAAIEAQLNGPIDLPFGRATHAGQRHERRQQLAQVGAVAGPPIGVGSFLQWDDPPTPQPAPIWQVAPLNPEIVIRAQRTPDLRAIIQRAPLVTADGMGVVWALRLRGVRLPERVTGVDLVETLAERAAACGYRLFLLGGAPGVAEQAGAALRRRHPGLAVVGAWAGSPHPSDDAETRRRICEARPDLLCVAYGSPAQERWIARLGPALIADCQHDEGAGIGEGRPQPIVAIGVGGALDLLAGRIPRAPLWMRRAGFEWLYRLLRQPWRWRRMLALPQFAWLALGEAWRTNQHGRCALSDTASAATDQTNAYER